MKRKARYFEFGYPHFLDGVYYNWPDEKKDYKELLNKNKKDLGKFLLGRLETYAKEFCIYDKPRLGKESIGLVFPFGADGGRWIEVDHVFGGYFISTHNVDALNQRIAAFNLGSDTLEFLDESILAPRVSMENKKYLLNYLLPAGTSLITNSDFNKESILRVYQTTELNLNLKLDFCNDYQIIENENGVIKIENGICQAKNFINWYVPKASFAVSCFLSLCQKGKS